MLLKEDFFRLTSLIDIWSELVALLVAACYARRRKTSYVTFTAHCMLFCTVHLLLRALRIRCRHETDFLPCNAID
jgi:hypothetical protein